MKEIIKMAGFDYHLSGIKFFPIVLAEVILAVIISAIMSSMAATYIVFGAAVMILPVQRSKNELNDLYGILPVQRKNITYGRFMYIWFVCFLNEILAIAVAKLIEIVNLSRFLPESSTLAQLNKETEMHDLFFAYGLIVGLFAVITTITLTMEMLGQINGRENDMRNVIIMLAVLIVLIMLYMKLAYDMKILPTLDQFNGLVKGNRKYIVCVIVNIVTTVLAVLFSLLTESVVSKREL